MSNTDDGDYHLRETPVKEPLQIAVFTYKKNYKDKPSSELFIHDKVSFNEEK